MKDDAGSYVLRPAQVTGMSLCGEGEQTFELPQLGSARWIDVEISAYRERQATFVVNPRGESEGGALIQTFFWSSRC